MNVKSRCRQLPGVAVAVGLVLFAAACSRADGTAPSGKYESVVADRGAINQSVATSGSVRPLVTVQVGSQLSGQVAELFADFNSEVKQGQLIARIDPQTFKSRAEAARAEKAVAVATLQARKADLRRAQVFQAQRKSDLARYTGLEDAGLSEIELDSIRTQYNAAIADVDSARAQIANAEAAVIQRSAALDQAELDLTRTEIRSPIDGVVIQRSVDVGQTVAASLSAPILFEIAQDLSRIQIEADVNEADIGAVSKGDPVSFTTDAYPGRNFSGAVETVRLAPVELQNVVTYTVIITADNPGRVLYPGMTATVEIVTGQREDSLRISNAAARFTPSNAEELLRNAPQGEGRGAGGNGGGEGRFAQLGEELGLTDAQQKELQGKMSALFAAQRGGGGGPPGGDPEDRRKRMNSIFKSVLTDDQWTQYQERRGNQPQRKTIWVLTQSDALEPRRVGLGIADGSFTEIVNGQLEPGERVVVREASSAS